jgi:hypothetical protein
MAGLTASAQSASQAVLARSGFWAAQNASLERSIQSGLVSAANERSSIAIEECEARRLVSLAVSESDDVI